MGFFKKKKSKKQNELLEYTKLGIATSVVGSVAGKFNNPTGMEFQKGVDVYAKTTFQPTGAILGAKQVIKQFKGLKKTVKKVY